MTSPLAGAVADPGAMRRDLKKRVARAERSTSSSTTTTTAEVLRIDNAKVIGGRTYTIRTSSLLPVSSVANDYVGIQIRATTDGSTPTSATTAVHAVQTRITGASGNETSQVVLTYNPAADGIISLLLTVSRVSGTGNASLTGAAGTRIEMWIDHDGEDPGSTGVSL